MTRSNTRRLFPWVAVLAVSLLGTGPCSITPPQDRFTGPTSSQPLALSANAAFLVAANPDNDSVSFFDLRGDRNRRVAVVPVQDEPNGVAFLPDGSKAFVANTVSGTVSVVPANLANGVVFKPTLHIPVGTEPYGLALTPNGSKLYVSNARSNTISRDRHVHERRHRDDLRTWASSRGVSRSRTTATATTSTRPCT